MIVLEIRSHGTMCFRDLPVYKADFNKGHVSVSMDGNLWFDVATEFKKAIFLLDAHMQDPAVIYDHRDYEWVGEELKVKKGTT